MEGKVRILVVDDDPDFVEMHTALLEKEGYEVITAHSSREGLDRVRTELPDLIILDLMMESHDSGFSFAREIKGDPLFKRIPVLMVTAVAETTGYDFSMDKDGYWMKTDAFLNKPIKPDVLISTVARLLQENQQ